MQIMPLSSSIFPSSVYVDESSLVITITGVVALLVVLFQWRLHQKKQRRKLPPGSMGWPYIGETLRLYTENPNSFFATRQNKYCFYFLLLHELCILFLGSSVVLVFTIKIW